MTEKVAISVQGVTKKYRLFRSPEERLKEALHLFRKRYHQEFWALKGISFDVSRGCTVGILGRNGSGKSTLLQIIASVLQPTSGAVAVHGRVSALLELGAGFNPEFTGRDNVLINGAIMGVSRNEMQNRMAAIRGFADIGGFFDQPVKTYSSGMFVRLAFSAAINIDPDILIVDEALAVGDAEFQQRCFAKFKEFQEKGVTIVFVTHDMEAVARHCQYAILLEEGRLISTGLPKDVVAEYIDLLEDRHHATGQSKNREQHLREEQPASRADKLSQFLHERPLLDMCARRRGYNTGEHHQRSTRAMIVDYLVIVDGVADTMHVRSGQMIDVYFKIHFLENSQSPCYGLAIKTTDGITIYALNSHWTGTCLLAATAGEYRVTHFRFPLTVNGGDIFLDFGVDEKRDGGNYANLTRRMAISHLVIQAPRYFHGLVDLNAVIEEVTLLEIETDRQMQ
jgi:ABC-type polysaccharide/polyol phosphate transport system ATPase subunit